MFNPNKYRVYDTFTFKGIFADVMKENEEGELIDLFSKDAGWISGPRVCVASDLTIERKTPAQYLLDILNARYFDGLTPVDMNICGDLIQFFNQENEEGFNDKNGLYYTLYGIEIIYNDTPVEEEDLRELFPEFCW